LDPGGSAVVEIGQGQGDAVATILAAAGFPVRARRLDLAGIPRCLILGGRA